MKHPLALAAALTAAAGLLVLGSTARLVWLCVQAIEDGMGELS